MIHYPLSLSNRYLLHEQHCRGKIWKAVLMVILVIMIDHNVCFFQVSKKKGHLQAESVACMLAILAWISWNSPVSKIFLYSRKSESDHLLFCQGSVVCACCQVWFFFIRFSLTLWSYFWWRPWLGKQSAIYQGPVVCACWFD